MAVDANGDRRSIIASSSFLLVVRVAGLGLTFVVGILLARLLGPSEYGIYSYVMAAIGMLTIPAQFGMPTLVTREVARSNGDGTAVRRVTLWVHRSTAVIAGCVFILSFLGLILLRTWFDGFDFWAVAVSLTLIPILTFLHLAGGVLRGLKRPLLSQFPDQIFRPSLFIVMLLMAAFLVDSNLRTASTALWLNIVVALCSLILAQFLSWNAIQRLGGQTNTAPDRETSRAWLLSIVPLALIGGLQTINKRADILTLGIFEPASEVGVYQVATRGVIVISFVLLSVNMVTGPYFAQYHKQARYTDLQALVTRSSRAVFCLSLFPVVIFAFWGEQLIVLFFGLGYASAQGPLLVLSIGALINCASGPLIVLLNMTGHERGVVLGVTIGAVSNVALNFVLIPHFGSIGAAASTSFTFAIWNMALWLYCRRTLGIDTSIVGLRFQPYASKRLD